MRWASAWSPRHVSPVEESNDPFDSTIWQKVLNTAEAVVPLAELVVMARGPVRPVDWAAIGMRAINSGLEIWRTWAREENIDLQTFFVGDAPRATDWKYVSPFIARMAFNGLEVQEKAVSGFSREKNGKIIECAWTATVDDCEIGWVSPSNQTSVPDTIWAKNPRLISQLASKRLWELAGEDRIIRLLGGNEPVPHELPVGLVETVFLQEVKRRVDAFLKANVSRSIILNGEPGCGKTTCAGWVARTLGYRTIVIEAADFVGSSGSLAPNEDGLNVAAGLTLAQLMRPEVLIVNDIDRLYEEDQVKLLDLFDHSKEYAKIVFATTNNYRKLIEPVRRPGRLDDFIHVPGLSMEEIIKVAPDCGEVGLKMQGWPIAYVKDMQKRISVLGLAGSVEFAELDKRLREARVDESKGLAQFQDVNGNGAVVIGGAKEAHQALKERKRLPKPKKGAKVQPKAPRKVKQLRQGSTTRSM